MLHQGNIINSIISAVLPAEQTLFIFCISLTMKIISHFSKHNHHVLALFQKSIEKADVGIIKKMCLQTLPTAIFQIF